MDNREILNSDAGKLLLAGRLPVREAGQPGIDTDTEAEIQQALDVLFLDAHFNLDMEPEAAVNAVSAFADGPHGLAVILAGRNGPQARAAAREFVADLKAGVLGSMARQARAALPIDIDGREDPHGCF